MRFSVHTIDQMARLHVCSRRTIRDRIALGEFAAAPWGRHLLIIVSHDGDDSDMEMAA